MVAWWTSEGWLQKHNEGNAKKAAMRGGSHRQGSRSLSQCIQQEVSKCILYCIFPHYYLLCTIVSFSPMSMLFFAESEDWQGADRVCGVGQVPYLG
jgi:hypothetical protein